MIPKISIMVPMYNSEEYIEKCLKSVIEQDYKDWELIITDDGSTDNSSYLVRKYMLNDKRIKLISQPNKGLLKTRRNMIDIAQGEILMFLDSDDYLDPSAFSDIVNIMDSKSCDLVLFGFERVSQNGQILGCLDYNICKEELCEINNISDIINGLISSSKFNNLVCKAVSKKLLTEDSTNYNLYKHLKNGEDLLQSLPLLFGANKIVIYNKNLYKYRFVSQSMSNIITNSIFYDIHAVRLRMFEYMNLNNLLDSKTVNYFFGFYVKLMLKNILKYAKIHDTKTVKEMLKTVEDFELSRKSKIYVKSYKFKLLNYFLNRKRALIIKLLSKFT